MGYMKSRVIAVIALAAMVLAAGCTSGFGGPGANSGAGIHALIDAWADAYEKEDSVRLANLFTDPTTIVENGTSQTLTRHELRIVLDIGFALMDVHEVRVTDKHIVQNGNTAQVVVKFEVDATQFGFRDINELSYVWTVEKVDRSWLISRLEASDE